MQLKIIMVQLLHSGFLYLWCVHYISWPCSHILIFSFAWDIFFPYNISSHFECRFISWTPKFGMPSSQLCVAVFLEPSIVWERSFSLCVLSNNLKEDYSYRTRKIKYFKSWSLNNQLMSLSICLYRYALWAC